MADDVDRMYMEVGRMGMLSSLQVYPGPCPTPNLSKVEKIVSSSGHKREGIYMRAEVEGKG